MNNITSPCTECKLKCLNFYGLTKEQLLELDKNSRRITYEKGETIIKQNSFVSHIIYICNGLGKIILEGSNGKNIIVKFLKSGDFIALPSLFNHDYYPYTVTALKRSEVCLIEINFFRSLVTINNDLSKHLLLWFIDDYKLMYNKLSVLGTKQLHGRLAEAILYMSKDEFLEEDLFSCITRKDMAELSSMSPESMIRLLNEFKNDKLISIKGKQIKVMDSEMLLKLSQAG